MAEKDNDQPSLAYLEEEGVRLHHCLASEGLSGREGDAGSGGKRSRKADSPPKQKDGDDGY